MIDLTIGNPDDLQLATNGRIYESDNGEPTCSDCHSTNVKASSAGNLYCADLCWDREPNS